MKLERLLRSQSAFLCILTRSLAKTAMSSSSDTAKAVRLAADIRAVALNILSYADSVPANLCDGGRWVASSENKSSRAITIKPDHTMLRALCLPWTSTTTSVSVNSKGKTNIATLAFKCIQLKFVRGNVLGPKISATITPKIYSATTKSNLRILNILTSWLVFW